MRIQGWMNDLRTSFRKRVCQILVHFLFEIMTFQEKSCHSTNKLILVIKKKLVQVSNLVKLLNYYRILDNIKSEIKK